MSPAELAKALEGFAPQKDPNILVGVDLADDAGVYRLSADLALVQTVDFFTPIVDDPYAFGQIAAANAISDIYAMGARPLTALNIIAFPAGPEPGMDVLSQILAGGLSKAQEAGVAVLGGHSVDDKEPKYGMAVTGTVHPGNIWSKSGAKPGDRLILTKPLGTGIIATAIKKGAPATQWIERLTQTASALNRPGAEAGARFDIHAATDVTGFGLINHLWDICKNSGLQANLSFSSLPLLPGVMELIAKGFIPGGTRKNLAFAQERIVIDAGVDEAMQLVFADAQTSGGLLLVLPESQAAPLVEALQQNGALAWAEIGELVPADTPKVRLMP